eukprot:gene878-1703_t
MDSLLLRLNRQYLVDSGISGMNLVFYRRDQFQVQFGFLENDVIAQSHIGWILGTPGIGKSSISLVFASTIDRNHMDTSWQQGPPTCIRFESTERRTCFLFDSNKFLIRTIRDGYDHKKNHIVFLDGFVGIPKGNEIRSEPLLLSEYARSQLAFHGSPRVISNMSYTLSDKLNPAMDGWILEMYFFSCLTHGGISLHQKNGKEITWPEPTNVKSFTPPLFSTIEMYGYDLQTSGNNHTLKIEHFAELLDSFERSDVRFDIEILEIVVVVESRKLTKFEISAVNGEGLLSKYPGWGVDMEESRVEKRAGEKRKRTCSKSSKKQKTDKDRIILYGFHGPNRSSVYRSTIKALNKDFLENHL